MEILWLVGIYQLDWASPRTPASPLLKSPDFHSHSAWCRGLALNIPRLKKVCCLFFFLFFSFLYPVLSHLE